MKQFYILGLAMLVATGAPALAEEVSRTEAEGPERILRMLNQKERDFAEGKSAGEDLSQEDREHISRIMRLHSLEASRPIITEPAGAAAPEGPAARPVVDERSAVEELEIIQQENTTALLREMTRLRAEVLRLKARVQALETGFNGVEEPLPEEQAEPRFYLPIR